MEPMTRTAPAKINLALDILRRRDDGYHDMKMVMQTVSLADRLEVTETDGGFVLQTESGLIPEGKITLEERATKAFFERIGQPVPGLRVCLEKHTPAYAGMGGGSADVAALLRILRDHYCPQLPDAVLEEVGFTVGSDMPFCVRGGTALAQGRGEVLTDLPAMPACAIVICKPDFGIPTPELFARVDAGALRNRPDVDGMMEALHRQDLRGIADRLGNVFEQVLPAEFGEVFSIKEQLCRLGALNALMSGSGPTVFALFERDEQAAAAAAEMKCRYRETYVAHPVKKF